MKFIIKNPKKNITIFFRHAGYNFQKKKEGELAFVRKLTSRKFPRFHAYCQVTKDGYKVNLHLDHKATSYSGTYLHSGEYKENELLEEEVRRLKQIAKNP